MTEPTLNLSQQHKIFDVTAARPVTIIGAGAVGSYVAVALAKMGVADITVYDGDYVESHNGPMSAYRPCDLSRRKAEALADIVRETSGVEIVAHACPYRGEPVRGAVICCVDWMEEREGKWGRREIWQCVVDIGPAVDIFIDTRIAAELVWVFAVNPSDPDEADYYRHHIAYRGKEAHRPMCGEHGIVYASMRAASAVCSNLTYWWQYGRKKLHHKELTGELELIA